MISRVPWPEGKDFAFTVFDDTDFATVENVPPVYDFLRDCGFRTTKSVWPLDGKMLAGQGATCQDHGYLQWLLNLQAWGFEIGFHGASCHSSLREDVVRGMESFEKLFGHRPLAISNHVGCRESIYWGSHRLTGANRLIYNLLTRFRHSGFRGHVEEDPHFWGDICRKNVKYVRNFAFPQINTLKACPIMPYHDPRRPYVNYWFASSEGPKINSFNRCVLEAAQDQLEEEGGACIMYTHFAFGFSENGRIDATFRSLMERLSGKNGWFVPVTTLLDYLLELRGHHDVTDAERRNLERRWLWWKIRMGSS